MRIHHPPLPLYPQKLFVSRPHSLSLSFYAPFFRLSLLQPPPHLVVKLICRISGYAADSHAYRKRTRRQMTRIACFPTIFSSFFFHPASSLCRLFFKGWKGLKNENGASRWSMRVSDCSKCFLYKFGNFRVCCDAAAVLRIGFVIIRTFVIFFSLIFHPTEMERKVKGGWRWNGKLRWKLGVRIIEYRYRFETSWGGWGLGIFSRSGKFTKIRGLKICFPRWNEVEAN